MKARVITIGDEILIGQIVDTNSVFISKELNKIGVEVSSILTIGDSQKEIISALNHSKENIELIILTGGLGPTNDDITKKSLCKYFNDKLVLNKKVLGNIEYIFKKYISTPINQQNKDQAYLPSKAKILENKHGTAPGMYFQENKKIYISLPGVPFEMKSIFTNEVVPLLKKNTKRNQIVHKTLMTYGLGESAIAEKIKTWEMNLPKQIKLAYLPNLGRVRLRLSSKGSNKLDQLNSINTEIKKLKNIIGDILIGEESETSIEYEIQKLFIEKKLTLSLSESCTGGKLSSRITSIPGSSSYFKGALVPYSTMVKKKVLKIPGNIIKSYSVVSMEVAEIMVEKTKEIFESDFCLSITGNAGPEKGDSDKEIGKVFISISTISDTLNYEFTFGNHRERVVNKAINKALELLLFEIKRH